MLEIAYLDLRANRAAATTPAIIYSQGTTLRIHDCNFLGRGVGQSCDQDAIVLGGKTVATQFQGYGTVIEKNYFQQTRRGIYAQVAANCLVFQNNFFGGSCGAADGTAGAIEVDGILGYGYANGNLISGNCIEMPNYVYGIRLANSGQNTLVGNMFVDVDPTRCLGNVRCEATAKGNLILGGFGDIRVPMLSEATPGTNNQIVTGWAA